VTLSVEDEPLRRLSKATRVAIPKGAVLELRTGGGGGFGLATERAASDVLADVRDGYLSEQRARSDYPHAFATAV
jgi:N-methylhydantoinase B